MDTKATKNYERCSTVLTDKEVGSFACAGFLGQLTNQGYQMRVSWTKKMKDSINNSKADHGSINDSRLNFTKPRRDTMDVGLLESGLATALGSSWGFYGVLVPCECQGWVMLALDSNGYQFTRCCGQSRRQVLVGGWFCLRFWFVVRLSRTQGWGAAI